MTRDFARPSTSLNRCAICGGQFDASLSRCPVDGGTLAPAANGTAGELASGADRSNAATDLAPGTLVGEYQIEQQIGVGGMGVVYGARHPVIGKRVAIKVLSAKLSADREAVARFVQEAQAVNQIGHAHIVDIFALGALPDGRLYLVMEWLRGETLADRIDRAPLDIMDATSILITLVRALEAAHGAGVVHRDLKPENVFLAPGDDGPKVKLLDFGIAKLSAAGPSASRTGTGITIGTPLFMSPEQARGLAIDHRTDIYALGVVAYAMLCGRTPFENEPSPVEILFAHISKAPAPLRELRPDLPAKLEALILELLAKSPDDRPPLADVRRRLISIATRSGTLAVPQLAADPDRDPAHLPKVLSLDPAAMLDEVDEPLVAARHGYRLAWWGAAAVVVVVAAIAVAAMRQGTSRARRAAAPEPTVAAAAPVAAPTVTVTAADPAPPAHPATRVAGVVVEVNPVTAQATIDGRPAALDHGRTTIELAPGHHMLSISAPGYTASRKPFDVTPGTVATLHVHLARAHASSPRVHQPDADAVVDPFGRTRR